MRSGSALRNGSRAANKEADVDGGSTRSHAGSSSGADEDEDAVSHPQD